MTEAQRFSERLRKLRLDTRLARHLLTGVIILSFSLFYFAGTCLRASEKYFWYDELFTLYICRLPTFHASWNAVIQGADFNPPLFYALTRLANAGVGEGLIGTRLPAIIGFWIFSLCLFRFVKRECGLLPGFVAMTFPLLTVAYYYAYEARPHGIVLGFCGLALVFWQAMQERPREARWLIPFGLSLGAAFFSHCYAVILIAPFAIAEAFSTFRSHRLQWGRWAAMIVPLLASMLAIVPLFESYNRIVQGTWWARVTPAKWSNVADFYKTLLTPSLLIVVLLFTLLLLSLSLGDRREHVSNDPIRSTHLVLAVSFVALPFFGVLVGKAVHGPFIARYFMAAVVGLSVLVGFAAGRSRPRWVRTALVCVIALSLSRDFIALLVHRYRGWGELLLEPGSGQPMDTDPGDPLARYRLMTSATSRPLPILVPDGLQYVYLTYYDVAHRSRLYYVGDFRNNTFFREYHFLRILCDLTFNSELTLNEFVKSHSEFFIYGNLAATGWVSDCEKKGGAVKSIEFAGDSFLADIQMAPLH